MLGQGKAEPCLARQHAFQAHVLVTAGFAQGQRTLGERSPFTEQLLCWHLAAERPPTLCRQVPCRCPAGYLLSVISWPFLSYIYGWLEVPAVLRAREDGLCPLLFLSWGLSVLYEMQWEAGLVAQTSCICGANSSFSLFPYCLIHYPESSVLPTKHIPVPLASPLHPLAWP